MLVWLVLSVAHEFTVVCRLVVLLFGLGSCSLACTVAVMVSSPATVGVKKSVMGVGKTKDVPATGQCK